MDKIILGFQMLWNRELGSYVPIEEATLRKTFQRGFSLYFPSEPDTKYVCIYLLTIELLLMCSQNHAIFSWWVQTISEFIQIQENTQCDAHTYKNLY